MQAGSLPAAIEFFGLPSSYAPQGDLCQVTWDDLGLAIAAVAAEGRFGRIVAPQSFAVATDVGPRVRGRHRQGDVHGER